MCVSAHLAAVSTVALPLGFRSLIPLANQLIYPLDILCKVFRRDFDGRMSFLVVCENSMDARVHIWTVSALVNRARVDICVLSEVSSFHFHARVFFAIVGQKPMKTVVLRQAHGALVSVV